MTDPTTARPERPIRAPRGTALSGKGNLPGVTRP
jgi:hypothetical protein